MTQYVVYQFDTKTGVIKGTNSANRSDNDPFLSLPGNLALLDYLTAVMTTTHPDRSQESVTTQVTGGGWGFSLDVKGNPQKDAGGNYILVPPPWTIFKPSVMDYAVLGHIKSGALNPATDLPPAYIVGLNRALASLSLPVVPNTTVQPTPTRTAQSANALLSPAIKGAVALGG